MNQTQLRYLMQTVQIVQREFRVRKYKTTVVKGMCVVGDTAYFCIVEIGENYCVCERGGWKTAVRGNITSKAVQAFLDSHSRMNLGYRLEMFTSKVSSGRCGWVVSIWCRVSGVGKCVLFAKVRLSF